MASKSSYDEELSNGESSKGNNSSLIVNVNDTQSDIEDHEESNYSDQEENESEQEHDQSIEPKVKNSRSDDSGKRKKSPEKESRRSANVDPSKTRYIWVSGIPIGTKTNQLEELFMEFGKVLAIKIIRGGASSLLGFVKLETVEQAQKCMEKLDKTEFRGNQIELFKERPVDKEDKKPEKIGFRDSRKFIPHRPIPLRRPLPPFRGSPRTHFRGSSKPMSSRIHTRHSLSSVDFRRPDREETIHLEREKQRLKLERMKLERDKAELFKIERESRNFERDRFHDDKRMRSMVKRPIDETFIDDKRYDDYNRREDFSRRYDSRSSPDRKISSSRSSFPISSRGRYEDSSRQDRFSDSKFSDSSKWNMPDSNWVSGNDRWQSSSYESPRMLQSTISSTSLGRIHSNSDISQSISSRGYFSNNRRY